MAECHNLARRTAFTARELPRRYRPSFAWRLLHIVNRSETLPPSGGLMLS